MTAVGLEHYFEVVSANGSLSPWPTIAPAQRSISAEMFQIAVGPWSAAAAWMRAET